MCWTFHVWQYKWMASWNGAHGVGFFVVLVIFTSEKEWKTQITWNHNGFLLHIIKKLISILNQSSFLCPGQSGNRKKDSLPFGFQSTGGFCMVFLCVVFAIFFLVFWISAHCKQHRKPSLRELRVTSLTICNVNSLQCGMWCFFVLFTFPLAVEIIQLKDCPIFGTMARIIDSLNQTNSVAKREQKKGLPEKKVDVNERKKRRGF